MWLTESTRPFRMDNLRSRIRSKRSKYNFSSKRESASERVDWEFVGFPAAPSAQQPTAKRSHVYNEPPITFNFDSLRHTGTPFTVEAPPPPIPPRQQTRPKGSSPPARPTSLYSRLAPPPQTRRSASRKRPRSNDASPTPPLNPPNIPPHKSLPRRDVPAIDIPPPPIPRHMHASGIPQPLPLSPPAPPPPPHATPIPPDSPFYQRPDRVIYSHVYDRPASLPEFQSLTTEMESRGHLRQSSWNPPPDHRIESPVNSEIKTSSSAESSDEEVGEFGFISKQTSLYKLSHLPTT